MNEIITRKEAIKRRLLFYRTGKPCKRGHVTKRYVSGRACLDCKREFSDAHCKLHGYNRKWNREHIEEYREYQRVYQAGWRKRNPERHRATQQRYYKKRKAMLKAVAAE